MKVNRFRYLYRYKPVSLTKVSTLLCRSKPFQTLVQNPHHHKTFWSYPYWRFFEDLFYNLLFKQLLLLLLGTMLIFWMSFWILVACICNWLICDLIGFIDCNCDLPAAAPIFDLVCFCFCNDWTSYLIIFKGIFALITSSPCTLCPLRSSVCLQ